MTLSLEKAQGKVIEFLVRDVTTGRRRALPTGWDAELADEEKKRLGLSFTDEDEIWPAERIMEFIQVEFERNPEFRSSGRSQAVQIALDRIARAGSSINNLEEATLLNFISGQSARVVSRSDLNKQLLQLRRGPITGENHSELATAAIDFIKEFGELRFDGERASVEINSSKRAL